MKPDIKVTRIQNQNKKVNVRIKINNNKINNQERKK